MTNYFRKPDKPAKDNNISHKFSGYILRTIVAAAVVAMVFFAESCEEDPTSIGINLLPTTDFDKVSSDLYNDLQFYTMFDDSLVSRDTTFAFLGWQSDPFFGKTKSDFVSQLWLYNPWPNGGLKSVDSVFMTITVTSITGEITEGNNNIMIYENGEFLSDDSTYYVTRDVSKEQLLGTITLPAGLTNDTVMTFPMPRNFGEVLMSDTSKLFISNTEDDFRSFFRGLYFDYPQTADYNMVKIDLTGTFIGVYYTNGDQLQASFTFTMNPMASMYYRHIHDFDAADPSKKIKYINQPILDTMAYVQSFDGVYTKIVIPGLEELKSEMPVSVNKARIYIPAYLNDAAYTEEMVPSQLLVRYTDADGNKQYVPDYLVSDSFIDGGFNLLTNRYKINLVNFVQQYLNGDIPEPAIELFIPGSSQKNLILSANGATSSPWMEIVYTEQ